MAQHLYGHWKCDTCHNVYPAEPWKCPVCGKEVCEICFDRYTLCADCGEGKTDEEAKILGNWIE